MKEVIVIGIGNLFRGDDAAGIHALRKLARDHIPGAALLEHTGNGVDLLTSWNGWRNVIVVDAMKSGATPGTIRRFILPGDSLPVHCFQSGSTHAIGIGEAIELARHTGGLPELLIVYGIEGREFWLGSGMTGIVASQIERLVAMVAADVRSLMDVGVMKGSHSGASSTPTH